MAGDRELDQLLHRAIENKQLLRFKCNGNGRIAEPHDYGIQNGIVRCSAGKWEDEAADAFLDGD